MQRQLPMKGWWGLITITIIVIIITGILEIPASEGLWYHRATQLVSGRERQDPSLLTPPFLHQRCQLLRRTQAESPLQTSEWPTLGQVEICESTTALRFGLLHIYRAWILPFPEKSLMKMLSLVKLASNLSLPLEVSLIKP